jgi:tRNA(Ile)-lysidine synthase
LSVNDLADELAASGSADLLGRCRFPFFSPGMLFCAVSGGADSTALAVLAVASGFAVTLFHVNHGLRPEAAYEHEVVASLADRLGAEFVSLTVHVGHGPNLEERARDARYAALPADVCTGHTADDLAETVLLNLTRGSGLDGVASMARPRPGGVQRPLLGLRRADTMMLCKALELPVVEDSMNVDARFRRVRMRTEVLPLLDEIADRDVAALLARHAEVTADDVELLSTLSESVDMAVRWPLRGVPLPLARRAVRRWLLEAGALDGRPIDADTVERVLAVAEGSSVGTDVGSGWRVERRDATLSIIAPATPR